MDQWVQKINRLLMSAWLAMVVILICSYTLEIFKGTRSIAYVAIFASVTALPTLPAILIYRRRPDWKYLRYFIIVPYFILYVFVILNQITPLVFAYILPMLSLMVLYHDPKLILGLGGGVIGVTVLNILYQFSTGNLYLSNSMDAEIQIGVLLFSFWGSYQATKLYDRIMQENDRSSMELIRKNQQVERITLQTVSTIAHALDVRDDYTQGHSLRVSAYSSKIARELGMSEQEVENIRIVALLHDIGKIGVPDSVLNKPGKLTDEEYEIMKQHPVAGGEILKDIETIPGVEIGARYHHERYDGRGYPSGLSGEAIPFIARIIAVADAYDAMTSNRVYRSRLPVDQVIAELERCSGTQFDPKVAQAAIRLLKEGRMQSGNLSYK